MLGSEVTTIRDLERYLLQQGASHHAAKVAASVTWRQLEPENTATKAICAYVLAEALIALKGP